MGVRSENRYSLFFVNISSLNIVRIFLRANCLWYFLSVLSSFAIISLRKRELVALF